MVTVKNVHQRVGKDNKPFVTLELIGNIELVQSQNTGRFYATARRCFVSSTFSLEIAKQFIGEKMPGRIVRVQCEPYSYELPESGETISLGFRYDYVPENSPVAELQPTKKLVAIDEMDSEESLIVEMS